MWQKDMEIKSIVVRDCYLYFIYVYFIGQYFQIMIK